MYRSQDEYLEMLLKAVGDLKRENDRRERRDAALDKAMQIGGMTFLFICAVLFIVLTSHHVNG